MIIMKVPFLVFNVPKNGASDAETKKIARVQNCPDIPILNSLFLVFVFDVVVFFVVVFFVVVVFVVVDTILALFEPLSRQHSQKQKVLRIRSKVEIKISIFRGPLYIETACPPIA